MKVLFVAFGIYSREGGMERFNRRVVKVLGELKTIGLIEQVSVLAVWDSPEDAAKAPGNVLFLVGRTRKLRALWLFFSVLLDTRPTVVIYGHIRLAVFAFLGKLLVRRLKQLLVVHGIEAWKRPNILRRLIVKRLINRYISVSAFTARRMQLVYGLPDKRFRLLANVVDVIMPKPGTRPLKKEFENSGRLLTVSRLQERYKNIDKVIMALSKVLLIYPDVHYYIVGRGEWRSDLEDLAHSVGVAEHVHFLGAVSDEVRDDIYAESQVFVLPSTGEGFGIVFLEAWQHGLPVIASDQDAGSEIVRDGIDGFCVTPEPAKLAETICHLLGNPERGREMGLAGFRQVVERYNHANFRHTLRLILEEVAVGQSRP